MLAGNVLYVTLYVVKVNSINDRMMSTFFEYIQGNIHRSTFVV